MSSNKQPNPWFEAKKLLIEYYANGKINDDTSPEQIHPWEEFKTVQPFSKFKKNFNQLKKNGFKVQCQSAPVWSAHHYHRCISWASALWLVTCF